MDTDNDIVSILKQCRSSIVFSYYCRVKSSMETMAFKVLLRDITHYASPHLSHGWRTTAG